MKYALLICALLCALCGCDKNASCKRSTISLDLASDTTRFSYSLGLEVGSRYLKIKDYIHLESLIEGIRDTLGRDTCRLLAQDAAKIRGEYTRQIHDDQAKKNMEKGRAFLDRNKRRPGVKVTPSGLQYEILRKGTGPQPKATDMVRVNYRGMSIDSTEFDNSYKRGQPAVFPLDRVIRGWGEAVQLMTVGSEYSIAMPSELAYGAQGAGDRIGPNETLIFELELLAIEPPPPPMNALPMGKGQ